DEEALGLAIVQRDDVCMSAARLSVADVVHLGEARLAEGLLDEVADEERARVAVPHELGNELPSKRRHLVVRNYEVASIAPTVRIERHLEVGQAEAQDAARLQDSSQLLKDADDLLIVEFRQRVNADGVVDRVRAQGEALPNVADEYART